MYKMLVIFFMIFWPVATVAEEPAAPASGLLAQLEGDWVSNGDAFGVPATTKMRWTFALGGKFMRLDYRIEMRPSADKISTFEGAAYYQVSTDETLRAFWADNAGSLHPIAASIEDKALTAHWGRADAGEQGKSRYELMPSGEVEVTDWVKAGEEWRQFNTNVFTRVAASE